MSVLKSKRTVSGGEFVNAANEIYVQTVNFLTRLSARYSRLLAESTAHLAGEVMDYAEKANSCFPSDGVSREERRRFLLCARASLNALDVRLTHCYLVLNQNPEGAFTTAKGRDLKAGEATRKLDNMAQSLGELIDREQRLLQGQLDKLAATK